MAAEPIDRGCRAESSRSDDSGPSRASSGDDRQLRRAARALPLGVWLALVAVGCGGASVQPRAADGEASTCSDAETYLPLLDGTVYSYDTLVEDTGERGQLIVQITRPRAGRIDLKMGSRVERLELRADGVWDLRGGYLLRTPLRLGAKWTGRVGEVTIVAIGRRITTPAGVFTGCLETAEERAAPSVARVATVFCPRVGIVSLVVEASSVEVDQREVALLRSFGPAVDVNDLAATAPSRPR